MGKTYRKSRYYSRWIVSEHRSFDEFFQYEYKNNYSGYRRVRKKKAEDVYNKEYNEYLEKRKKHFGTENPEFLFFRELNIFDWTHRPTRWYYTDVEYPYAEFEKDTKRRWKKYTTSDSSDGSWKKNLKKHSTRLSRSREAQYMNNIKRDIEYWEEKSMPNDDDVKFLIWCYH